MESDSKSASERLNNLVAITVVIISVFLAVSNVKDGNIGQNMALAKADAVDTWSEYQATKLKMHLAENSAAQLSLITSQAGNQPRARGEGKGQAGSRDQEIRRQIRVADEPGKAHEADYDALNLHDDQFDMSEAFLSISLALAGVAAITGLMWLLYFCWGRVGLRTGHGNGRVPGAQSPLRPRRPASG